MLNLPAFTNTFMNISKLLIIVSNRFSLDNKSYIINKLLNYDFYFNVIIKQISIIKQIEN